MQVLEELLRLLQGQLGSVAQLSHACMLLTVFTAALPAIQAASSLQRTATQPSAADEKACSDAVDCGHLQTAASSAPPAADQAQLGAAAVAAWLDGGQPAERELYFVAYAAVPALVQAALLVDARLGGNQ